MIAPTPFFSDRGAHVQIYEQANSLQKLDHQVYILTYGIGKTPQNLKVFRCWTPKKYSKTTAGPSVTKILLIPVMILKLMKLKKTIKPDILHAHLHEGALIAKLANVSRKTPVIFDYQGSLTLEITQYLKIKTNGIIYRALRMAERNINSWNVVVTQSQKMVEEINSNRNSSKLVLNIKDGVDLDRFKKSLPDNSIMEKYGIRKTDKKIIFMGYFAEHQGFSILLKAFKLVISEFPEAKLLLIGYPMTKEYEELLNTLGIMNSTVNFGRIDYFEVHKYLSLGDIAVAPKISKTEGDGKIYNYMAMSLPVVAFDREVSREILENTGIFCNGISPESLAEGLKKVIENPGNFGSESRNLAESKLSWDQVAIKLEKIYVTEIISAKKRSSKN